MTMAMVEVDEGPNQRRDERRGNPLDEDRVLEDRVLELELELERVLELELERVLDELSRGDIRKKLEFSKLIPMKTERRLLEHLRTKGMILVVVTREGCGQLVNRGW